MVCLENISCSFFFMFFQLHCASFSHISVLLDVVKFQIYSFNHTHFKLDVDQFT